MQVVGEGDLISRMPDNVIVDIMDRLPLEDAVRTSILSTGWRLKWTLLTQLILDYKFFDRVPGRFDKTDISRLLLHLKQVTSLALYISRLLRTTSLKLPTHLFSCLDLKILELYDCVLSPPYFHGLPKLLTLYLHNISIRDHKFEELITQCPLLETLRIWNGNLIVKLVEIAKLENVKVFGLSLCLLQDMTMLRLSTVLRHMSLLPKLQGLSLDFEDCEFFPEDVAQTAVSPTFPFLKSLRLYQMDFSSVFMLSCAFGMIFGCTNLQTLSIDAMYKNVIPLPTIFPSEVDCSMTGKLQLQNVRLADIKGLEIEVCLIKYILACSPMLKSIEIVLDSSVESNVNEKYKFANHLLKLH